MKDFFNLRESLTEDHLKIGQKVKTSDGKVGTVRAAGKGDQKGDYIIAVDGKTMSCNKSELTVVESTDINENYRTLARAGMGTESKGEARVGLELDYYDGSGTKRMGKITKVGPKGYIVKDEKDGKNRQFTFHDRAKAKEILARLGKGKYNESVELDEVSDDLLMRASDKAKNQAHRAQKSASDALKRRDKNAYVKQMRKSDHKKTQSKYFATQAAKRTHDRLRKESVELEERVNSVKYSRKDFESTKKGDKLEIKWGDSISSGRSATFVVAGKSASKKYDVEKLRLQPEGKKGGVKFFLYSRKGGDATFAIGDMAAVMTSIKKVS